MNKVIIIDDEPLAISLVEEYLRAFADINIVAQCSNGFDGIKAIATHQPDLVFLDIQMPKINGFEMLELIDAPPAIIFTTAYDEFAIKAFESNAVDYLLKPFSRERFDKAIQKWRDRKGTASPDSIPSLLSTVQSNTVSNRIVVKSGANIRIIPLDEILYVEAYDDYIKVHVKNDVFLKKQTMQQTEQMLGDKKFARVHRSYIINLSEITRIEPYGKDSSVAILRNGQQIPLSKAGYNRLKEVLGI